ncbi:MAG: PepSY domain-containing protein [Phreatobacter sp.]|nr:PepSY domain-containing protein [Phreatobacter sp.]
MIAKYNFLLPLVMLFALPSMAHAERDATAKETARVVTALTALGYRAIVDVDVVGNRFIVDARSPKGREVDVEVDRRTLRVIRERRS